ncbi:hypothetical protein BKA82DRAFT_449354 [Pisolithus tinctorius]|uniref:Uncharacterized protein n=1 Tax=Pisolithus tinctorius Marx 270 TaxID=870435 RepID=A0A0C3PX01_PISTI|nr:hypothetical protein BKA82DRAFT_449354 [Pisolithus tinctorius]KIO13901.1 hypothetical protein M404DRAFT_449354 [Pisolithus tinctorius Marx 270]
MTVRLAWRHCQRSQALGQGTGLVIFCMWDRCATLLVSVLTTCPASDTRAAIVSVLESNGLFVASRHFWLCSQVI